MRALPGRALEETRQQSVQPVHFVISTEFGQSGSGRLKLELGGIMISLRLICRPIWT